MMSSSKELKQYLERRIFNGKLVLFTFYDLCKFIRKMNGYRKVYNVPDRLFWLGDEIRRVLYCTHFEKGLTLEWNEGWDQLCKSRLKKQIIDLMSVISLAGSDRVGELRKLQEKLHCVIKKNLPFVASNFDGKDKKITSRQAEDFYEYITKICYRPDLIRIDLDKLRIHLTTIDDNSGIDNEEEMSFQY